MGRSCSFLYYLIFVSVGFLYPAYCSILALETPEKKDDQAWLMYWVIFALFSILEYFTDFILGWFPLYPIAKLGFIAWCVAPFPGQNGAYIIYKGFIKPFFMLYGGVITYYMTQAVGLIKDTASFIQIFGK